MTDSMQRIKRQISHLAGTISLDLAMGINVHNVDTDDVFGNASQRQIADVFLQNYDMCCNTKRLLRWKSATRVLSADVLTH